MHGKAPVVISRMISLLKQWSNVGFSPKMAVSTAEPSRSERLRNPSKPTFDSRHDGPGEDMALVGRARAGRPDAMADLVRRLSPGVFPLARAIAGNHRNPDDVAEAMVLRIVDSLDEYSSELDLSEWSSRIAIQAGLKEMAGTGSKVQPANQSVAFSCEEVALLKSLGESGSGWTEEESARAAGLFRRLMDQLTPAERLSKTLMDLEGRTLDEVCRTTGWSLQLADWIYQSASRRFQSLLNRACSDETQVKAA